MGGPVKYQLLLGCSLLFALGACGTDDDTVEASLGEPPRFPVPGCEHLDHAPCDTVATDCQNRVLLLAACLRGDDPGTLPVITVVNEQQYAERLTLFQRVSALATRSIIEPIHYERALELLGLIEPAALAPDAVVTRRVERVWGTYDSETDQILVIDHGVPADDPASNQILLHEFIHALQDRRVDLDGYYEEHLVGYDSSLALSAVIEGEARLHESD